MISTTNNPSSRWALNLNFCFMSFPSESPLPERSGEESSGKFEVSLQCGNAPRECDLFTPLQASPVAFTNRQGAF